MKRYDFIEDLELYGSCKYNGSLSGISVLDTSGIEGEEIYISFSINQKSFNTESLNYDFSDDYPIGFYYSFRKKLEESHGISSTSTSKAKIKKTTYHYQLCFTIPRENQKYLIIENLEYPNRFITIEHHKTNPYTTFTVVAIIISVVFVIIVALVIFFICIRIKRDKNNSFQDSSKIDFKKEEPSPLYSSGQNSDFTEDQTYSSGQSNNQNGVNPSQSNNYAGGQGIYQSGYSNPGLNNNPYGQQNYQNNVNPQGKSLMSILSSN